MGIIIRLVITAVSLWIATRVIDGIRLTTDSTPGKVGTLLAVAVIFGIVNAVLRPIIKTVGCGLYVLTLGLLSPTAIVYAIDVNERALELARINAAAAGLHTVNVCRPDEVPADVRFDLIWSNPPIRVGKEVLHDLLGTWLPRLAEGGEAYLVVQKNLGADSLHRWIAAELGMRCDRYAVSKGFRILRVSRAG